MKTTLEFTASVLALRLIGAVSCKQIGGNNLDDKVTADNKPYSESTAYSGKEDPEPSDRLQPRPKG